ncbi:MAG: GGDEF domain-containing protein [Rubripirellula sp.]|nr:GGDEF domain-containing protein [Rubripirellula sp.]
MLDGFTLTLLAGLVIALLLVLIGYLLGKQIFGSPASLGNTIPQGDQERMVQLLKELGNWTNEYSGNVSQYQHKLGELSAEVRNSSSAAQTENRVFLLLQQIMQSNETLKTRLDVAERQLEKQTLQIQCYLTEARTDTLTGLFNRRAFDHRLEEMFLGYKKGGRGFVVALIDIDRFKTINDTRGHQVGDEVLKSLSAFLRIHLDQAIMVSRFGGEEFAVILDGPLRVSANRMNEIRRVLERETFQVEQKSMKVTISVGVAEPQQDLAVGPILRRADEALYSAKNTGRNRVYFHDGRDSTLVGAPELAPGKR